MKKIIIGATFFAFMASMAGCEKNVEYNATRVLVDSQTALLKINYGSLYPANYPVQLSINGVRMSGLITGRTPFPGGGFNTSGSNYPDYLALDGGSKTLTIAIPKVGTNVDSVVLFNNTFTIQSGKNYTAHVTDTFTKTKLFLDIDSVAPAPAGFSRYKFVNIMPNVPAVDLYFGTEKVASNITYLSRSPYFTIANPLVATAWFVREAGTSPTGTVLATYSSSNTYVTNRVYTVFALGYKGSTATTTKPYVSFFLTK